MSDRTKCKACGRTFDLRTDVRCRTHLLEGAYHGGCLPRRKAQKLKSKLDKIETRPIRLQTDDDD